jgi:hypothetical protein
VCRIGPVSTTWNALPGTVLSSLRLLSSQRGSVAPLMYQLLPLSATIIPYVFSAREAEGCLETQAESHRWEIGVGAVAGVVRCRVDEAFLRVLDSEAQCVIDDARCHLAVEGESRKNRKAGRVC